MPHDPLTCSNWWRPNDVLCWHSQHMWNGLFSVGSSIEWLVCFRSAWVQGLRTGLFDIRIQKIIFLRARLASLSFPPKVFLCGIKYQIQYFTSVASSAICIDLISACFLLKIARHSQLRKFSLQPKSLLTFTCFLAEIHSDFRRMKCTHVWKDFRWWCRGNWVCWKKNWQNHSRFLQRCTKDKKQVIPFQRSVRDEETCDKTSHGFFPGRNSKSGKTFSVRNRWNFLDDQVHRDQNNSCDSNWRKIHSFVFFSRRRGDQCDLRDLLVKLDFTPHHFAANQDLEDKPRLLLPVTHLSCPSLRAANLQ